jgi:hypothetical protein
LGYIIETALGADFYIDRGGDVRGEVTRRVVRWVHHPDPATAKVAKEIFTDITGRELVDGRIVKGGADNRASTAAAMSILK